MVTETVEGLIALSEKKIEMLKSSGSRYLVLSMMAGIYVGFGIVLIFSIGAPLNTIGSVGLKALMGVSFGVALTLVIFAGSELFTGNNMIMTIGSLAKKVSWLNTIKLWSFCFIGNLIGSLLLVFIVFKTGMFTKGPSFDFISNIAFAKGTATFQSLFLKGILCNMLVCLAVWTSARTKNDGAKILLIFWCLFNFIGSGFEHSIANMSVIGIGVAVSDLVTWGHFWHNMIPVTLGNMVGGGFFIGAAYWFVANKNIKS